MRRLPTLEFGSSWPPRTPPGVQTKMVENAQKRADVQVTEKKTWKKPQNKTLVQQQVLYLLRCQNKTWKENLSRFTKQIHPPAEQHCPLVVAAGEALSSRHLVSLLQTLKHTLMFYSLLKSMWIIFWNSVVEDVIKILSKHESLSDEANVAGISP